MYLSKDFLFQNVGFKKEEDEEAQVEEIVGQNVSSLQSKKNQIGEDQGAAFQGKIGCESGRSKKV